MLVNLLRYLGVTPEAAGKSGKREAAWAYTFMPLFLTLLLVAAAIWMLVAGRPIEPVVALIESLREVLIFLWTTSGAFLFGVYKLESDQMKHDAPAPPPEWEAGAGEGLT